MDRSTQGSPAKFSFCFGENEEESPWAPYHVRRGFAADESVITVSSSEPPHNINDHASTSGEGILRTIAGTISEPVYLRQGALYDRARPRTRRDHAPRRLHH